MTAATPRRPVEVVRRQWQTQHPRGEWRSEWLARRGGQRNWQQGTTARQAIRRATLAGKQPGWLLEAAAAAEEEIDA